MSFSLSADYTSGYIFYRNSVFNLGCVLSFDVVEIVYASSMGGPSAAINKREKRENGKSKENRNMIPTSGSRDGGEEAIDRTRL